MVAVHSCVQEYLATPPQLTDVSVQLQDQIGPVLLSKWNAVGETDKTYSEHWTAQENHK